jgi:nanoRNase/pAp phosphatase (c-di-AMP/oligoRNAs hydrolase)
VSAARTARGIFFTVPETAMHMGTGTGVGGGMLERLSALAQSNPEVAAALTAGLLVVVGGSFAVARRRAAVGEAFVDYLRDRDHVAVLMHPNPDPDAMAAGLGVVSLAEQVGTEATLQFPGEIRHQENRAFQTVLEFDCEHITHVSDLAAEGVVLVDHNAPRGFAGAEGVLPGAVIDHHPGDGRGEEFTDVRTDYGACSSIVAEYFRDVGAKPVPPDVHQSEVSASFVVPSKVATGLLYGILTDTKNLTIGASSADFSASGYLYGGINEDLLERIANPQVSAEVLEVKARAIAGRQVRGSFAVSHIGEVSNVDAIPQAADELMQLEGVTAVVVCGESDGTVYLSGRSRDDRIHMGQTLDRAVSPYPGASAGGHARMGGGQLPADASGDRSRTSVVERIFETLSGAN